MLLAVTVVFVCWSGFASPAAAQQASDPLRDLVLAGAPLVASTGMPSDRSAVMAAASSLPVMPGDTAIGIAAGDVRGLAPGAGPEMGLPNPLNLLGSLDPRHWATAVLDTVVEVVAGALLEAIRGFVDWALGFGDSSLNIITQTPAAGTYESSTVRTLWELSRGVANGALAVIVMWGGFNVVLKQHTRSPYDGVMELLPRVILAALAVNLTLEIARVLIELNNAFAGAVGEGGLPGYDQASTAQDGMALVMVAVTYGIVALLLAFQMLMRLALICMLIVLAPVMVVTWVLPQTQSWARWWAHLLPITVFQQAVQVLVLRLGAALMVELTPGSAANALLTLLLGIAVCYLTLRVPSLLSSQTRFAGLASVVSLVVLSRAVDGLGARGGAAAAGAR
ncbi:MAG: hypothetical protein AMXMBFR23_03000 [Chloroflexota bacterium]